MPRSRQLTRSRRSVRSGRTGSPLVAVAEHAVLIAVSIMMIFPLLLIAATALMTSGQALSGELIPSPVRLGNFTDVFATIPFARYFMNTVIIAVLTTLGMLLSSVPAAYALARFRFPGRRILLLVIIAAMMLPGQVTVIPLYVMWAHLGLTGTPVPLILPSFLLDAFSVFLLRQFFITVPDAYLESARLDGAGELRTLWYVFLPLVKSALAAVALFSFFYSWNEYFNPLLYLGNNERWYTLSVALASFKGMHGVEWNLTMAATLIFIAPVIVLFFLAQRAFVQGISLTGVKG